MQRGLGFSFPHEGASRRGKRVRLQSMTFCSHWEDAADSPAWSFFFFFIGLDSSVAFVLRFSIWPTFASLFMPSGSASHAWLTVVFVSRNSPRALSLHPCSCASASRPALCPSLLLMTGYSLQTRTPSSGLLLRHDALHQFQSVL
jgi:hypothetical protein